MWNYSLVASLDAWSCCEIARQVRVDRSSSMFEIRIDRKSITNHGTVSCIDILGRISSDGWGEQDDISQGVKMGEIPAEIGHISNS